MIGGRYASASLPSPASAGVNITWTACNPGNKPIKTGGEPHQTDRCEKGALGLENGGRAPVESTLAPPHSRSVRCCSLILRLSGRAAIRQLVVAPVIELRITLDTGRSLVASQAPPSFPLQLGQVALSLLAQAGFVLS